MADSARRDDEAWELRIPEEVGEQVDERVPDTAFDSVDEYVTFVLKSLLRELDQQDDDDPPPRDVDGDSVDADGRGAVEERLESLGYL